MRGRKRHRKEIRKSIARMLEWHRDKSLGSSFSALISDVREMADSRGGNKYGGWCDECASGDTNERCAGCQVRSDTWPTNYHQEDARRCIEAVAEEAAGLREGMHSNEKM